MLDDFSKRFIHCFLTVWYKPTDKSCYYNLHYLFPRWEVGYQNGYGHEVIAVIDLSLIFFKERYKVRRKLYSQCILFFQKRLIQLNKKEKKHNDRFMNYL